MPKRRTRKNAASGFVYKTFGLLQDPSIAEIVAWDETGTAFEVKNVTAFSSHVLPRYFNHSNFTSFVRQLNMYDFRKEPGRYCFSHPQFSKASHHRLRKMRRKVTDSTRVDHETNSELQDILREIYSLQRSQNQLQLQIASLQGCNQEFREANEKLGEEIARFKERCQRMDQVTKLFLECVQLPRLHGGVTLRALESLPCDKPFPLLPLSNEGSPGISPGNSEETLIAEDVPVEV